jgi:hypothetical protein
MVAKLGILAVFGLLLTLGSGCIFGVYSKQDYGPGGAVVGIEKGQNLEDVVTAIGAPDKIYDLGNTKLLVYTRYEGMQVAGIYSNVKKNEIVVILEGGKVARAPIMVAKGEAITILGIIPTPIMGPAINKEE